MVMKSLKKLLCLILIGILMTMSTTTAYANSSKSKKNHNQKIHTMEKKKDKKNWKVFKINKSKVIKYGKYKLPTTPITKGMGADVTYDKKNKVITVTKDQTSIVIDLKGKKVDVNGKKMDSDIFKVKNNKMMKVLIQFIADILKIGVDFDDYDIIVDVPKKLDPPKDLTVTPVGPTVYPNTINSTTEYIVAYATITPGQATGGRAELYVGSKLVAIDSYITEKDDSVIFSTSDGSPTNSELKSLIPVGGEVKVKLYDAKGNSVTSKKNPKLTVDYIAPTLTEISSAIYNIQEATLYIIVKGASNLGDTVDVTKLSLYDSTLGKVYKLTNTKDTGSKGSVKSDTTLVIKLGSADRKALEGFGTSTVYLAVSSGSLISDEAGNTSPYNPSMLSIPVSVIK